MANAFPLHRDLSETYASLATQVQRAQNIPALNAEAQVLKAIEKLNRQLDNLERQMIAV